MPRCDLCSWFGGSSKSKKSTKSMAKDNSSSSDKQEAPPLTPQDIVGVLQDRGWEAEICRAENVSGELFNRFDLDKDGNVDLNELKIGLEKELGVTLSEPRVRELMKALDKDGDGSIQADKQIVLVDGDLLVDVHPSGILKCVDGRGSDNTLMGGPKMPGGVYAIAHNRGVTTMEGLRDIAKECFERGHVPSVHGDHSSDMMGCGFLKLWLTGRFDDMGYPRPEFDADQGAQAVRDAGGVIEMHHGGHEEKVVLINLVPDKTLEPIEDDQRFIVDGWSAGKFELDVPKFLVAAAATVEMLNGPKKAKIIVP